MPSSSALGTLTKRYAWVYRFWYIGAFFFLGITIWISLLIPSVIQEAIDHIDLYLKDGTLFSLGTSILFLGLLQMVVRSLSRALIFWPGRKIEGDLKNDLFQAYLHYPLKVWEHHPKSRLMSHLSFDTTQLRMFFAFAVLQGTNFCFLLVFLVYHMAQIHEKLVCVVLLPLGLTLLMTRLSSPVMHRLSLASQENMGLLTKHLSDTLSQAVPVQILGAQWAFLEQIRQSNERVYQGYKRLSFLRVFIFPMAQYLTQISYLLILYYGGWLILKGELTLGQLMAFHMYVGLLSFPLMALGFVISIYHRAKAAAMKTMEYLSIEQEQSSQISQPRPSATLMNIQNLWLPKQTKAFNAPILEGKKIAITGKIGSGKTTLLHYMSGLWPLPSKELIFFQGIDVSSLSPELYRKKIGYGLQVPYFFSGTIKENLLFGLDQKPQEDRLWEALIFSHIKDEIANFTLGLDTLLGEKGLRLSGGQKQRLSLARLYLRDPDLWLLDDITSALDEETEKKVLDSLSRLKKTIVMVSHRPLTLHICDEVICL